MTKVTYFDVEWANNKNKSICQMGVMCEDFQTDEPFCPEKNIYVNPQDNFDDACIKVHGISSAKVADAPTFPQIWQEVAPCFTNSVIIAHNAAGADLDALTKNLQRYNIDIPELYYIDTLAIAHDFVPQQAIDNYSLSSLCAFFGIDVTSEHDAFDDACACKDLFLALKKAYNFDFNSYVRRYHPNEYFKFVEYVSNPTLRRSVTEFYGALQGIGMDGVVSPKELAYIKNWRQQHKQYDNYAEIATILSLIDEITADGVLTADELRRLRQAMIDYFNTLSSAEVTVATQVLSGLLKGIASDGVINESECVSLNNWLYQNDYLRGHYPFDKITALLDEVLADNIITPAESQSLIAQIDGLLNPVVEIGAQLCSVDGLTVCLSGNFAYGAKSKVEEYIVARGGMIVSAVSKKVDMLVVGDSECGAYAYGNYGKKTEKAKELQAKGSKILILTEREFFQKVK